MLRDLHEGEPDGPTPDTGASANLTGNGVDMCLLLSKVLAIVEETRTLQQEVRDLLLLHQRPVRDYYSTDQVAQILGRANWTVREWCRTGRVNAEKRRSGRGRSQEWVIPHAELLRVQKEGLLPFPKH